MIDLTERRDLRGGHPCWPDAEETSFASDPLPTACDVAIIGAGIMGAMIAERLSGDGYSVAMVDRRPPARGSTAASTALVSWAADVPLCQLVKDRGEDEARRAWRRVHRAVKTLAGTIGGDGDAVRWREQPELYLAGNLLDASGLKTEAALRQAAGLRSTYLPPEDVQRHFELPARAALLSSGCFVVDPIALTLMLLRRAQGRGATISFPADAMSITPMKDGLELTMSDSRRLRAKRAVLASGYEVARWYLPASFALNSSYAIATAPGIVPTWAQRVMIWEASSPYLYARATADGRVIIGGEDEEFDDATARDRLIEVKRGMLEARGAAMLGLERLSADCAWAATFGSSPDGMPAMGRARNAGRLWLAAGFGGNGISFAALAAAIIGDDIAGRPDADAGLFSPYRFE